MCVVMVKADESEERPQFLQQDNKSAAFSLSNDDCTLPTLDPASDSSSGSDEGTLSQRGRSLAVTTIAPAVVKVPPTRTVTNARAFAPKPPLPIQAVHAMSNCAHFKCGQVSTAAIPQDEGTIPDAIQKKPSSMKRRSPEDTEKHVSFGDLEMRHYAIVLGDHPDCSSGPPVSIGWEYSVAETVSVDKYEEAKPKRRSIDQLELNYFVRKRMLRRTSQVSDEEMRNAIDEVRMIQKQRMRTRRMQPLLKLEEATLSLANKLANMFIRKEKDR